MHTIDQQQHSKQQLGQIAMNGSLQLTIIPDDLVAEDMVVLGLATCFVREGSQLIPTQIIEPIPSAMLGVIAQGNPTSYSQAHLVSLGELAAKLSGFLGESSLCENFEERLYAATRTYRAQPVHTTLFPNPDKPLECNFSTQPQRILNQRGMVSDADNIKQHPASFGG
jgi:hypothetical protein